MVAQIALGYDLQDRIVSCRPEGRTVTYSL